MMLIRLPASPLFDAASKFCFAFFAGLNVTFIANWVLYSREQQFKVRVYTILSKKLVFEQFFNFLKNSLSIFGETHNKLYKYNYNYNYNHYSIDINIAFVPSLSFYKITNRT